MNVLVKRKLVLELQMDPKGHTKFPSGDIDTPPTWVSAPCDCMPAAPEPLPQWYEVLFHTPYLWLSNW